MKSLPIGTQSFSILRNAGYLYVDKTSHIHRMITSGRIYFLSRPRRFGKSLLVSTLEEIFKGNKALFEGLYICDHWDWTQQHPILRLDFGGMGYSTPEELHISLHSFVERMARSHQLSLAEKTLPDKFRELIEKLHQSTGHQVVVLVDEYDKPIIDHLTDLATAEAIRKILHDFYQVLKAADEHLRFVFLTGVSKFSKVSIFSGLNSPDDITMDARFSTICGYTQEELESNFEAHIQAMMACRQVTRDALLASIRYWYNGYSWDGVTSVYNPFSTLLLFSKQEIGDYWFASGTPTFLVKLVKERNDVRLLTDPVQVQGSGFDKFDIQTLDTKLLLFQTGYLTVKQVEKEPFGDGLSYTLGIPNEEVRRALMEHLVGDHAANPQSSLPRALRRRPSPNSKAGCGLCR
ncbi:MAG: AAA family ATPase [Bacteroidales bacterium]|jgi:hypothetical protein|nr:AAA family ATPase [Bacteroidales bacterium]